MAIESSPICIADVNAVLGEGPVWVAGEAALYWVDINGRRVFRRDLNGSLREWIIPMRIGSIVPRTGGGFIAGTDQGIVAVDLEVEHFEPIANPEADIPGNRFNDGKVDRSGRFWAGTMDDREREAWGSLYRIDAKLACTKVDTGYKVTNGPAFSPDGGTMYHSDSALQITYAFDVDTGGNLRNRRTFRQFDRGDGFPDGMTIDAEGCLWIAFWDGWCVRRFSPQAELLQTIQVPVARPTSCAFGGADLDELYITSASRDLDEQARIMQPNAGGLFMVKPGVRGIGEIPFAG